MGEKNHVHPPLLTYTLLLLAVHLSAYISHNAPSSPLTVHMHSPPSSYTHHTPSPSTHHPFTVHHSPAHHPSQYTILPPTTPSQYTHTPSHGAIQNVPDQPPLLWVYNLVIALFQLAKYQDIVDVHCCKLLEGSYLVLEGRST